MLAWYCPNTYVRGSTNHLPHRGPQAADHAACSHLNRYRQRFLGGIERHETSKVAPHGPGNPKERPGGDEVPAGHLEPQPPQDPPGFRQLIPPGVAAPSPHRKISHFFFE